VAGEWSLFDVLRVRCGSAVIIRKSQKKTPYFEKKSQQNPRKSTVWQDFHLQAQTP